MKNFKTFLFENLASVMGSSQAETPDSGQTPYSMATPSFRATNRMEIDDGEDEELKVYEEWFKLKMQEAYPGISKELLEKYWKEAAKEIWKALESGKNKHEIIEILRQEVMRRLP